MRVRPLGLSILLLAPLQPLDAAAEKVASVFLKDSEVIVAISGSGTVRQLTSDGLPKSLPVASKDGSRIAFVNPANRALGMLVAMSPDGKVLSRIAFRPVDAGISGMRFVERLEWLTNQSLVVAGSVNPSTCEYAIVDIGSGREIGGYFADGFSWAASPDGSHAAYVGYIPHFTPEENRHPQLCFDDECKFGERPKGYPPYPGPHIEFRMPPAWSPDGSSVVITGKNYDSKASVVIVRRIHAKPIELTAPPDDDLRFSWEGNTVIVRGSSRTWRLEHNGSRFIPSR